MEPYDTCSVRWTAFTTRRSGETQNRKGQLEFVLRGAQVILFYSMLLASKAQCGKKLFQTPVLDGATN